MDRGTRSRDGAGGVDARALLALLLAVAGAFPGLSCAEAEQPPYAQVLVLRGTPYQRGFQHGQALAGRIRSLYTTLLTNALMPYLDLQQYDVSSVLSAYKDDPSDGITSAYEAYHAQCVAACTFDCTEKCGFSYMIMLDSALSLKPFIPQDYLDEMQGIADGAGLPFEKILILNTFFDTLMEFRAITYYIQEFQAPTLEGIHFPGAASDGVDNNGDGRTDEPGEGDIAPFEPMPHATLAEVPTDTKVVIDLHDLGKLAIGVDKGDQPGVDPKTVRVQYNDTEYTYPADKGIIDVAAVEGDPASLTVTFAPPGGFRPAAVESLILEAGDFNRIVEPPPLHARFMRDERIVFTTKGYGKARTDVPNIGPTNTGTQPPAIAFAARGTATAGGEPLLAHHFALVDSNTMHKHTVAFVHVPDQGLAHVVLGYAGLVWGLSGMNEAGLTWTFTTSDTLNNPMVGTFRADLFDARLAASGVPIGIVGRDLLLNQSTTAKAVDVLKQVRSTYGWNVLMADAGSDLAAVELDSNIEDNPEGGASVFRPDASDPGNLDPETGRPLASAGPDDLRIGSHYQKQLEDLRATVLIFDLKPQRYWTGFYYRSVRAVAILGERLGQARGSLDAAAAVGLLRTPQLVDTRDSMIAAVYEPKTLRLHCAMGQVPATAGEFVDLDLGALWARGVGK